MKTKSFLLFSTSVFATSIFLIVFHSQEPQSIQNIVTQTHQHIKDFQENLRDVEDKQLWPEERYLSELGLGDTPPPRWLNVSRPVLVTYARGAAPALSVAFVRAAARLPHTLLLYDLGLTSQAREIISSYCNSTKCVIVDFDLSAYPAHINDDSIHAVRPLVIQHAMSRVDGVVFADSSLRWRGSAAQLQAAWAGAAEGGGVRAWPRHAAVTSLTHPRMFRHLRARPDDFLFVQMVDVSRLLLARTPELRDLMRAWVRCALTLDCIMPIGAQSGGCRFDKKPQYRYSGCHEQDASALSILLALRSGFEEARYTYRGRALWQLQPEPAAQEELASLLANTTHPAMH